VRGGSRNVLVERHLRARESAERVPGTGSGCRREGRGGAGAGPASTRGGSRKFQRLLDLRGRSCTLHPAFCFWAFPSGWLPKERQAPALLQGVACDVILLRSYGS